MSEFRDILRQLRIKENKTQDELAKELGISRSSVSMYERGEREPDFETLEAIADYFNVDMNYLLGKTDDPENSDRFGLEDPADRDDPHSWLAQLFASEDVPDESFIILSRNAKKLSPEKRKQLLDMARLMFKEEFED